MSLSHYNVLRQRVPDVKNTLQTRWRKSNTYGHAGIGWYKLPIVEHVEKFTT